MGLAFGTAGIRAPLGEGPDRMNRGVVRRVSAGLAAFLTDALAARGGARARVVVGYDARRESDAFALDTVGVLADRGHEALLLPRPLPTPVLAYAVRHLDADAGVMITASHNPAGDNGYKVYLGGRMTDGDGRGAQIVGPVDRRIEEAIGRAGEIPAPPGAGWTALGDDIEEAYIRDVAALLGPPDEAEAARRSAVRIVLTPLHGVGGTTAVAVLERAGFPEVLLVAEQAMPDPEFPTAPRPNPEEPGAMDLALALAEREEADVAIALDPDADRCAVAAPVDGRWAPLHGDLLGCLLGERIARAIAAGRPPNGTDPGARALASSIVSSTLLSRIAAAHGLPHRTTLTGFKWLARVPGLAYGYEEALGVCVAPALVRDKDGVSAALAVASMVADLKGAGSTIADAVDGLDAAYGVHRSRQVGIRTGGVGEAAGLVESLTAKPPRSLAGSAVRGSRTLEADGRAAPGVVLDTASGARVIVRPSGTEPKAKAYIEVMRPPGRLLEKDRSEVDAELARLERDVRATLENGDRA